MEFQSTLKFRLYKQNTVQLLLGEIYHIIALFESHYVSNLDAVWKIKYVFFSYYALKLAFVALTFPLVNAS